MRQTATGEVRLDERKATSSSTCEASTPTIWLQTGGGCDRILFRAALMKRKIIPTDRESGECRLTSSSRAKLATVRPNLLDL